MPGYRFLAERAVDVIARHVPRAEGSALRGDAEFMIKSPSAGQAKARHGRRYEQSTHRYEDTTSVVSGGLAGLRRGTRVLTPNGEVVVEDLAVGDLVETVEAGPQPIRWVGISRVEADGEGAPVRIAAGAFGNTRDLWVTGQHRLLVSAWQAEILFGERSVLAPAAGLVDGKAITIVPGGVVEYHHLLLDRHLLILSEGAASEISHPYRDEWSALDERMRADILQVFPDISKLGPNASGALKRRILKRYEACVVREFMLHKQNQQASIRALQEMSVKEV